jgi:hypothetical protein
MPDISVYGLLAGDAAVTSKSGNYSLLASDQIALVDTSGGSFTLTLPDPSTVSGHFFYIVDQTGSLGMNPLTLARFAAEMIEGVASSKVFQTAWGGWTVFSDGTNWFVF